MTATPIETDELRALAELEPLSESDFALITQAANEIDELRLQLCESQAMSRAIEDRMMMGRR